jgi:hypothetical protein
MNILGFAVLLILLQFLGYPPRQKADIPDCVRDYISRQLKFNVILFDEYRWKDSRWEMHLSAIREFTGFKAIRKRDSQQLFKWLMDRDKNAAMFP